MEGSQGCQNAKDYGRLRSSADEFLKKGATPRASGGALSVDALTLLYHHASVPETAAGALFKESVINLAGEALCGFLAPGREAVINSLLRKSGGGGLGSEVPETSLIELPNGRCLTINVRHTAAEDRVLVILAEINTPVVES